uniref:NADH-ubiquinone oxidoreductase chain 2 n=1 Tax=Marphysa sanguinea TaxID=167828 RepID=V5W4W4_MARSA|nr:NADH dehydrogenase subunit 2 [Marphysa sanguinea]AHC01842.1 NADH dehydrogenase subunit 2 [Marphysa sanguinea]
MYLLLPHIMLFMTTLLMSTLAVVSSSTFLTMWAALELNLMSIIPLMLTSNNKLESEAAVKYFLAQALGSSMFLISYLALSQGLFLITNQNTPYMIMSIALMIKVGAAPTHFWFPSVMSSSSWLICILLATWQKIAPLTMITIMFPPSNKFIFLAAASSSLIGGILGLNQTQLTSLLAYSSIGHLGWILAIIYNSKYMGILYFSIYAITTSSLMILFYLINTYSIKQTASNSILSSDKYFIPMLLLLSLGGLPPLLGFAPKLMTLTLLSEQSQLSLSLALIIGSTLNLSYYLALAFNLYISSTNPMSSKPTYQFNLLMPVIIVSFPLIMAPLMA